MWNPENLITPRTASEPEGRGGLGAWRRWVLLAVAALALAVLWVVAGWGSSAASNEQSGRGATGSQPATARRGPTPGVGRSRTPAWWAALRAGRGRGRVGVGSVVLRATWGSGPGQLGRKLPAEGAPEGPASFVVDEAGRVYVLDQVNERIQVFAGGKVVRIIKLPGDTFEDIALLPGGGVAVLDRLARRTVASFDSRGRLISEVALEGPGVAEGGGVTGLFRRDDGLWVEVGHRRLVRVVDANGQEDLQRPTVSGRFSADGQRLLQAALDGRYAAEIITRAASSPGSTGRRLARLEFPMRIANLTALESDAQGRMYLGAVMMRHRPTPPHDLLEQSAELVVVSAAGRELRRIALPPPTTPLEFFRSIRVGRQGTAWHLAFQATGATLRRYRR